MKLSARLLIGTTGFLLAGMLKAGAGDTRPNIIVVLSDDQGWGDVGFNGNPVVRTPHLDQLAREGVRLDRFYAAGPVCSPTRGSILTGRHPSRYGINWAYEGRLPSEEVTLAELLREAGYRTGHFGKWHLGQMSRTLMQGSRDGARAPVPELYSPPWENGFDTCFTSSGRMPTWNPYFYPNDEGGRFPRAIIPSHGELSTDPGDRWPENYWTGPGCFVDEVLTGDDSAIIMDRALAFIRSASGPFFACIWFHTPHTPVVAGPEWRQMYAHLSIEEQHWYGAISAMDQQVGRLVKALDDMGLGQDTLLWFCSDNGPSYAHPFGSAGPFSGRKGSLREGGVRVPAVVKWPAALAGGRGVAAPLSTCDIFPTAAAAAGVAPDPRRALDGADVTGLLRGRGEARATPVFFNSPLKRLDNPWAQQDTFQAAVHAGPHKLVTLDSGASWQLYDLAGDPAESADLAARQPVLVESLQQAWAAWRRSCEASARGADYLAGHER